MSVSHWISVCKHAWCIFVLDRGFLQVFTGQTQHTAIIERALFWDSPDLCLLTLLLVAIRPWASLPPIFSVGGRVRQVLGAPKEGDCPVFLGDTSRC